MIASTSPPAVARAERQLFDELKLAVAEAAIEGRFDDVETLLPDCRLLQASVDRPPMPIPQSVERALAVGTGRLRVSIGGHPVSGRSDTDVFVASVKALGLEQVQGLAVTLCGLSLVDSENRATYQNMRRVDSRWLCVHSNTKTKAQLLRLIAGRLGRSDVEVAIRG